MSPIHKKFIRGCTEKHKFWRYTSERFLYLWDLVDAYNLENIFHLEYDNMLYANLSPLIPIFKKHYPGIGATFDNDERCIPGFVWISNKDAIKELASYFSLHAKDFKNDMVLLGKFRNNFPEYKINSLPIIMEEYTSCYPLVSPHNHTTKRKPSYYNNAKEFKAIFDAAAIGQYLGGVDPIHKNNPYAAKPGFINESCLFNPSKLDYIWEKDAEDRLVPYVRFGDSKYKIINLHIHSKRVKYFKS